MLKALSHVGRKLAPFGFFALVFTYKKIAPFGFFALGFLLARLLTRLKSLVQKSGYLQRIIDFLVSHGFSTQSIF